MLGWNGISGCDIGGVDQNGCFVVLRAWLTAFVGKQINSGEDMSAYQGSSKGIADREFFRDDNRKPLNKQLIFLLLCLIMKIL